MTFFVICAAISILGTILYLFQIGAAYSLIKRKRKTVHPDISSGHELFTASLDPETAQGTRRQPFRQPGELLRPRTILNTKFFFACKTSTIQRTK